MFLISKKGFLTLFILTLAGFSLLGIWGYWNLLSLAGAEKDLAIFTAQRFFYVYILILILFLLLAFRLLLKGKRVIRELDKLIHFTRETTLSSGYGLKKLGIVGDRIDKLYKELNLLNEKKSLKISALSDLVDLLVAQMDIPLLITDVAGRIVHVSRGYLEKNKLPRSEILGFLMEERVPEIVMPEIIFNLEKKRTFVEQEGQKGSILCYPLYDRLNNLSFILFSFEKKAFSFSWESKNKPRNEKTEPRQGKSILGRLWAGAGVRAGARDKNRIGGE